MHDTSLTFPTIRRRAGTSPVLALGNFDGLHRGHMKIIDRVRRRAGERGGTPAAMTFDPHPPRVLRPDKAPPLLMTTEQKLEALGRAGMQGVAVVRFTHELSLWDPETFVRTVLVEWLHVVEVWVGANFLFGHDRAGTFSVLRTLGARYGFRAEKIDPVRYKDFVVSSTRVRRLVAEGRVDEAAALLGHHYFIDGTVVARRRPRPRASGFRRRTSRPPTSWCRRPACTRRPRPSTASSMPSVTNIGMRPDVRRRRSRRWSRRTCFDIDRDLYDADVRLSFVQRLRDERAFPDVDALRAQIDADCRSARAAVRPHFAVESFLCQSRRGRANRASSCGCRCPHRGSSARSGWNWPTKVAE